LILLILELIKGKKSVELSPENLELTDDVYSLVNIDFNKYRFRLVDGLTVETLSSYILGYEKRTKTPTTFSLSR
jgi:hypothetical protein